ncbi:MAG: serine hydrolase domain-containing protein [Polyangiales bacterium]
MRSLLGACLLLLACGDDATASLLDDDTVLYPGSDWESAEPAQLGLDAEKLDALVTAADANDSHCVMITRKGRLVGEWYFDGWSRDSRQIVHSVTKSFTSALVGIAQDRGLLRIQEPASKWITEWAGTDSAGVTVKHLLSNDSGREWTFIKDYLQMAGTASDKTAFAVGLAQAEPPGTFWEYNNSAIQTLERVLEKATQGDVDAFARTNLFAPLGIGAQFGKDAAGNTLTFGNLSASCDDLMRFGYMLLRKGKWQDTQVVSEAYVAEATKVSQPLNAAYGYLFWLNNDGHFVLPSAPGRKEGDGKQIEKLPTSTFSALGLGGQLVTVVPELELVMTRIGGNPDPAAALASGGDPVGQDVVGALGNALGDAIKR